MRQTKRSKLTAALCVFLCAALLVSLGVSCARRRRVVTRTTANTTDETSESVEKQPVDSDGIEINADTGHIIVIDPGHGVGDDGYTSEFTYDTEAQITKAFADALAEKLTARGYTVYLTHDGDTVPETDAENGDGVYSDRERSAFANEKKADYFLSIHCNMYSGNGAEDVTGIRVYASAAAKADTEFIRRAGEAMCASLSSRSLGSEMPDLIVSPEYDSYPITTYAECVSLLLMLGYMTNEHDVGDMTDPEWIERTAELAASGIDAYFPKR